MNYTLLSRGDLIKTSYMEKKPTNKHTVQNYFDVMECPERQLHK